MREVAETVGGLITLVVLLGLLSADVLIADVEVSSTVIVVLLSIVGALLGIDIGVERFTDMTITIEAEGDDDDST